MAPSIEAQIKQKRRQLVADGVDPFLLLAEVLTDNDRLRAQVERLQAVVKGCSPDARPASSWRISQGC